MQYQLLQKPDFTFIKVTFDQGGEQMLVEPSAMVAKDSAVEMKTANVVMIIAISAVVNGELRVTYPPQPMRMLSDMTIVIVSRKNTSAVIQKIGDVSW